MIVLGLLAVVQMTFLPGALLLRALKMDSGLIRFIVAAFGASLLINYLIVLLFVTLRIYTAPGMGLVLFIEFGLLAWLFRQGRMLSLEQVAGRLLLRLETTFTAAGDIFHLYAQNGGKSKLVRLVRLIYMVTAALLGLAALLWLSRVFFANLGSVFNSWDAVLSWNRWATQWASNHFPTGVSHYPQLLPANLSIPYVLLGDTRVQMFSKAILPLFTLYTLLLLFSLGLQYRSAGFFLAAVVTRYLDKKFLGEFISEGYADLPVAFFAFAAVYCLFQIRAAQPASRPRYLLLGMLLAAGAAVTKQAGLYLLFVYPLLAWLALGDSSPSRQRLRLVLPAFGLALLIVLPWYLYAEMMIQTGREPSEVAYLTQGIHELANPLDRLLPALLKFEIYQVLWVLLIPAALLLGEPYRSLSLVLVLPFGLIWALYFSYEVRNAAMILPSLALVVSMGFDRAVDWILGLALKLRLASARAVVALLPLALLLALAVILFPGQRILAQQTDQQKQIFSPTINEMLYNSLPQVSRGEVKIMTNYPLAYLPGFEDTQVSFFFRDYNEYLLARKNANINYILMPAYAEQQIAEDVLSRVESGEYRLIFEDPSFGHYYLVEIQPVYDTEKPEK